MRLSGQQLQQIQEALLDAYSSVDDLRMLARFELSENLDAVAGGANLRVVVFNLLTWAEQHGRLPDLIAGACRERPGNALLAQVQADARHWLAASPGQKPNQPSLAQTAPVVPAGPAAIDLFLCYSHRDLDATRQVQELLRGAGLAAWLDEGLEPGTPDWQDAITEAIRQAQAFVVLLSPNANGSRWVKREIDYAQAHDKRIFPLLLAGEAATAVPLSLIDVQWVDGRGGLAVAATSQLLPALLRHLGRAAPVRTPPLDIEWITIPAGAFLMGSDKSKDSRAREDETPQHDVFLPEYRISKYPITNAQYFQFVQMAGYRSPPHWADEMPPREENAYPVVGVSWHDACSYCTWASQVSGRRIRLPSEAEWEKAARGLDGRIWPWGDDPPDATRCNFGDNDGSTLPVGEYPLGASPYEVLDMIGHIWEWTSSRWTKYPYTISDNIEVAEGQLDNDTALRVLRGGAFHHNGYLVRCAARFRLPPDLVYSLYGFRVVSTPYS